MKRDYIPMEKLLLASRGSIYKLAIMVAKRALQLADGEKPLIDKPREKLLDTVIDEILAGKIRTANSKD